MCNQLEFLHGSYAHLVLQNERLELSNGTVVGLILHHMRDERNLYMILIKSTESNTSICSIVVLLNVKITQTLCRFWSSRKEPWPWMVPQGSTVSKVFGSRAFERYRYDLTLLEAAARNDDGDNAFAGLVKQSTAALLNSYARDGFPYTAWEVKTLLIQGLVSEKAASFQAQRFSEANQACN